MSEKIISFPGAEPLPDNPIEIKRNDSYYCSHEKVSLDEHQRCVNCLQCGAVLDAFNFLHKNARTLQTAWQSYRMVQNKVSEIQERLRLLEREKSRLSAQVKRLQEKAAPMLDVRAKENL